MIKNILSPKNATSRKLFPWLRSLAMTVIMLGLSSCVGNFFDLSGKTNTLEASESPILATRVPPTYPSQFPLLFTPLPTFTESMASDFVIDLYQHNPCTLPCWWGIEPGITDWRTAWQFLEQFATNKSPWETQLIESSSLPGFIYFRILLNLPPQITPDEYSSFNDLWFVINADRFVVDYIDINVGNLTQYSLTAILQKYGKPNEIWVLGLPSQVSFNNGVSIYLYYPDFGFFSSHYYVVDPNAWNQPTIDLCEQKLTELMMWNSDADISFIDRLRIGGFDSLTIGLIKSINRVSTYDIETFYETFANSDKCIEFSTPELLDQ